MTRFYIFIVLFGILLFQEIDATNDPVLIAEWVTLEYDWEYMNENKTEWIESGRYIPNNCALAGIKQYQDRIFLTVPVW